MNCPGCGAATTGSYCANCGQRLGERVLSVGALLREVLEDQFSVNATLPRTLRALFFRPGLLTTEYLRLRISPYVPPFRLYLVVSVLFFLALSLRAQRTIELTAEDRAEIERQYASARDSLEARRARGDTATHVSFGVDFDPSAENWADSLEVHLGNERLNRAVKARLQEMRDLPPEQALHRLGRAAVENVPKAMFLLLPLHALILKVLYLRSRRYYVAHFIFSLHVHAFAFSLFLLTLVLPGANVVGGLTFLWLLVYHWVALKRVYEQGWVLTTLKWAVLALVYLFAVALCIMALFTIAVFVV